MKLSLKFVLLRARHFQDIHHPQNIITALFNLPTSCAIESWDIVIKKTYHYEYYYHKL